MKKLNLFLVISMIFVLFLFTTGCGGSQTTPPLTYTVGDTGPAGGLIFYDKGSYSDGLETGATGTAIGTGQANTTAIVTIQGAGNYAAQLCNDLTVGGYNDWFLPSKDELDLMYENLHLEGFGDFADALYWSSSEYDAYDANYALVKYFVDGGQGYDNKDDTNRVRAVRAF